MSVDHAAPSSSRFVPQKFVFEMVSISIGSKSESGMSFRPGWDVIGEGEGIGYCVNKVFQIIVVEGFVSGLRTVDDEDNLDLFTEMVLAFGTVI